MQEAAEPLGQYRVLVVEDDYFLASELTAALTEGGAIVLGPASTVGEGRRLAFEQAPDCVLLDCNLHGEHSFQLADELRTRGIPIIFTTGFDSDDLPNHLQTAACLSKPVNISKLGEFIRAHLGRSLQ